jgi:hypothetical protein
MNCLDCKMEYKPSNNAQVRCKPCAILREIEKKKIANARNAYLNKGKIVTREVRYCIGFYCRGDKKFTSINGKRLCPRCSSYINGFEDTYLFK